MELCTNSFKTKSTLAMHEPAHNMDENPIEPQEGMSPELEEVEVTDASDRIAELEAQLAEERQAKTEILARAKKAEAQAKATPKPSTTNSSISEEIIEAKILLSQGKSPELIEEMKALAKVRGKSLLEIQNDPILVAMEKAREEESNAKKVKLGAARGSSTVVTKKSTTTAGLSAEEHRALWNEQNS